VSWDPDVLRRRDVWRQANVFWWRRNHLSWDRHVQCSDVRSDVRYYL
jgi:hypothetical protein